MMPASGVLAAVKEALLPAGILLRGVVRFAQGEGPELADGRTALTVVLLGNGGGSIWPAFSAWHRDNQVDNPLDTWSRAMIDPVARQVGAMPFYPSEAPYMPFQQWAMTAEGLKPSPLGILIHPKFGLWHGYRGALAFAQALPAQPEQTSISPCDSCLDRPCLTSCPAESVKASGFDVFSCRAHLATGAGRAGCMAFGCAARNACPAGAAERYPEAQLRFHMASLFPVSHS